MIRTLIATSCLFLCTLAGAQTGLPDIDQEFDLMPDRPRETTPMKQGTVKCYVKYISEPIISATEAGLLLVAPSEGQYVEVDELIAQTDDTDAKWVAEGAKYGVKALEKDLESDIRLRYSEAQKDVRKMGYEKARRANQITPGAIPEIDLMERRFQYKEAELSYENTMHERAITEINLSEKRAEWQRAIAMMERHKVLSPIRGFVAEVEKRKGEYVRPGDPIARLVQLDRVRIAASLDPGQCAMDEMVGRNVQMTIDLGGPSGRTEMFSGVISFANPRLDSNGKFEVWAEVDVPNENLRYGMQGTMVLN